jgi:hypothetical protein
VTESLMHEEIIKKINESPEFCPITGMYRCDKYLIDNKVVYLPNPAYDAYTLPTYNIDEKAFYHTRYNMDDDFSEWEEHLCDLENLTEREDFELIKKFYNIKD